MPIDYKIYPPNWLTEIRPRILLRANNCCEHCGIENYQIKRNGTKVVLNIAHLDHDPPNHAVTDDRLAALCQQCHFKYDFAYNMAKRKYGAILSKLPTLF